MPFISNPMTLIWTLLIIGLLALGFLVLRGMQTRRSHKQGHGQRASFEWYHYAFAVIFVLALMAVAFEQSIYDAFGPTGMYSMPQGMR